MRLDVNNSKFNVREVHLTGDILLVIKNLTINDTANYTIVADNGYKRESKNFDVRVIGKKKSLQGDQILQVNLWIVKLLA